jgi:Uma2 family endonuclease
MTTTTQPLTLTEFLKLPETQPASEFIDGQIYQKPMPQGKHSTLQIRLADTVNEAGFSQQIAYAFPELRCTFFIVLCQSSLPLPRGRDRKSHKFLLLRD